MGVIHGDYVGFRDNMPMMKNQMEDGLETRMA